MPGDTEGVDSELFLLAGRLWSNMLVFWLQKIVAVDSSGQSRVYGVAGAGAGGRDTWEKHKQVNGCCAY